MDGGATASAGGGSVTNLGGLERWWSTSGIALWSLVLFGSFLLNATLLLAFVKLPRLRTISNRFVMNLTASNLLTCSLLTPLLMLDVPSDSCTRRLCAIAEGVTALVTASSILSVLLIAVDQYFAVVDPLRYRGRVSKLKCGIVIGSVWVVSILFGFLATFNPDPRGLWLFCGGDMVAVTTQNLSLNSTLNLTFDSSVLFGNGTKDDYNVQGELEISEERDGSRFREDLEFMENSTIFFGETSFLESFDDANVTFTSERSYQRVTYGIVYTAVYSVFVYLLPFVGVCWIYVSIYLAAHKNSERARRTGSGPMLSSASSCEDYCQVRQEYSTEDFRRIPKISSLSSIDESTETAPSQMPRRRSEVVLTSTIEEASSSSAVVFTVGSQKVNVTPQRSAKVDGAKESSKVPVSTLKAEFLGKREEGRLMDELVRSKFLDRPDDRRKSSHDLMYEEMLKRDPDGPCVNVDSAGSEDETKEMLQTFAKSRRLRDIVVSVCQNSIDDPANRVSPMVNDDVEFTTLKSNDLASDDHYDDRIVSSGYRERIVDNGATTKIDLDDRGARSTVQNGCASNGRVTSGRLSNGNHRSLESAVVSAGDLFHRLNGVNCTIAEVDSSGSLLCNSSGTPTVTVTPPNKIPLHRVSSIKSTSSYINSLKYRISNASLFKYREETRAARISALVIVMGFICWTPYAVVLNLRNLLGYENKDLAHRYDVLALSLLILAAYVSPLLFGYRSRRVKRELRKIFCFRKELSYKNNRSLMAKKVLRRRHSGNLSQFEVDSKYNIFSCVYGRNRWPKEKVQFMQVPETALAVETCRSSFSSGASTQISSTSTDEC